MRYRVELHPDVEGFPNHWLIQKKPWYSKRWRFHDGYYITKEEAERAIIEGEYYTQPHTMPTLLLVYQTSGISVGDYVTSNERYNLKEYFNNGPLKVVEIKSAPQYAGGACVMVFFFGKEVGFYLNGIKKA